MASIIEFPARVGSAALDVSLVVFAPMAQVRARALEFLQDENEIRLFNAVFRKVARCLVAQTIESGGQRSLQHGLHPHNACGRAVDLLDLADELEALVSLTRGTNT